MIKIIIVDDQKLFRESLKNLIIQDTKLEVIACAENGQEAFELCDKLSPDIVLMDIKMPICDGIEGTKLIKKKYPLIKVLMLTMFGEDGNICESFKNQADGYILKDISPEELIQVIKNTAQGFGMISKKAYDTIINEISKVDSIKETREDPLIISLKENEKRLIQLIAEGKNNKELATILCLSEGRIKNIITGIFTKLKLKDRYQLLSFAYKNKLIK